MRRLARALDLEMWGAVGVLESLWHWTARYAPAGDVGRFEDADLADGIGWRGDPDALVAALVACGWIDQCEEYRLVIHDWHEHADEAVHMALARAGKLFADGQMPKIGRLPKEERERISALFERTASARQAHNIPSTPPEPRQSHTLPEPAPEPAEAAASPARRSAAPPAAWAMEAAEALRESVRRRWPGAPVPEALIAWSRELERIRAPAEAVQDALRWYVAASRDGDRYVPECRSGRSFREKYDKVLAAMKRAAMPVTSGPQRPEPGGRAYRPFVPERRDALPVVSVLSDLRKAVRT